MICVERDRVNRLVLHKQHLTADSRIDDVVQVVKDVGGLHATNVTTPYLSLSARCQDFSKDDLDRALYGKRVLGKIRCVRKTIYIVTKEMIPVAHAATADLVLKASKRFMEFRGISPVEYDRVSGEILGVLESGEMTASEIKQVLGTTLDVSAILYFMCDQGLLTRGRPAKGWKDKRQRYALFQEHYPDVVLGQLDEMTAVTRLVSWYLRSFGPVTVDDIAWWTGLGKRKVRAALSNLEERLESVSISDLGSDFLMLCSDVGVLEELAARSIPEVNLLPDLDSFLMGYKKRERYLDGEYNEYVFDRSGNVTSTILVDGRVVGVWDFRPDARALIKLFMFTDVGSDVLDEIYRTARQIGVFIADQEFEVKECDTMTPLTKRPAGGIMSPLRDC